MPPSRPPRPRPRGARRWRRRLLGAALGVALAACGNGEPQAVTLAELALAAEDYDGEVVETVGVVRAFTEAEDDAVQDHFAVEDADHNRVELVPHAAVEPHVDDEVRIVGTFAFSTETGRRIEVDEIEPTGRPADLAP